jgi:hypothetical protein
MIRELVISIFAEVFPCLNACASYRTPLCVLFPPRIIASACYVLAQRAVDGPHSASLDARISASPPSASLPTPPSHKPASPDASRFAVEYYRFAEEDIAKVSGTPIGTGYKLYLRISGTS